MSSLLWGDASHRVGVKPEALHGFLARNISVVVPCFGHTPFLEETLRSIVMQQYPPVEIIIVDDGSVENCGNFAQQLLATTLAPERRQQAQRLRNWWGWEASDMDQFSDEVLITPNRGVAHARNVGIRRARGDWICCIDGDDRILEDYFVKAMMHVAQAPQTNLVYAKQQFFGESCWQWHVPDLRVDDAIVRGPLPLMTLWRKDLWMQTPHGFDEVLPRGHEDWAFWLQLTRLNLHFHKIDEFLTEYRFKKNSKMRNRERHNPEVPRLMRCLFPDLYPVRKLLLDHVALLSPGGFSETVVMEVSEKMHLYPTRAEPPLWVGMILESKGAVDEAAKMYNLSARLAQPFDWQGLYRLWRALERMGSIQAARREKDKLSDMWGSNQMQWYSDNSA